METDIQQAHKKDRGEHRGRDQRRNDQAGSQSEKEQHNHGNHDDCLQEVVGEGIDFSLYIAGLKLNEIEFHANRVNTVGSADHILDGLPELQNIAAFPHRYCQPQAAIPGAAHHALRRIDIAATNRYQVLQPNQVGRSRQIDNAAAEFGK